MDNTAQKQNPINDNNQSQVSPQPLTPPISKAPVQTPPPDIPTGSVNKEVVMAPVSDFVKPTETPLVKDKEVAEAGVSEVSQSVELSREHEKIGIKPAAEATPVKIEESLSEAVQLPMTQVQANQVAKTNKNSKSSIVWLAILMIKHFKKMRRKLMGKGD